MLTDLGERLALIIDAKTDGAISNIRALSAEEKAAGDRADLLKAKITDLEARQSKGTLSATASRRLANTKNELAGLEASLAQVPTGSGVAERALAKLGLQGSVTGAALAGGLATAGAGLAAFGGFEFLKAGIDNYTHLADEIRAVQQASGSSTQDASKFVAITSALGVSSDSAALGLFRLAKNIDLTPQKLTAYGIAVARTKDGNVDLISTLDNVADAYQRTTDPAKRAAIVYEAFGRAGTTMLPILNANREQLKGIAEEAAKQGRIFSPKDLENARQYEIAMRELGDSWQSLGIAAGKTLVPALSDVAKGLTLVGDAVHSRAASAAFKGLGVGLLGPLAPLGFIPGLNPFGGGGGGTSTQDKAAAELQAQQDQQLQAALSKAAAATLGDGFSLLAFPGQALASATQQLNDATTAVANAVAERAHAERALADLRAKGPGSSSNKDAVDTAAARVQAAQARLKAAEYVGGDANISSARAGLLSAQKELNTARAAGGTYTSRLADATERLHRADAKVAASQRAQRQSRAAKERASGLSAADILGDVNAQLKDKTALTNAQAKLVSLGASTSLVAYLDQQNAKVPGTLVKAVKGLNKALVSKLNDTLDQTDFESGLYSSMTGTPSDWEKAGQDRGSAFSKGFEVGAGAAMAGNSIPAPGKRGAAGPAVSGGITVTVQNLNLTADDPKAMARQLAERGRTHALSGAPRNASLD